MDGWNPTGVGGQSLMARQKFEKTFNTFTKGLMTEASELNFPEDFSLYEKNFVLKTDGGGIEGLGWRCYTHWE